MFGSGSRAGRYVVRTAPWSSSAPTEVFSITTQPDVLDPPSPAPCAVLGPALPAPFRVLVFPSVNEPGLEIIQALARSNKIRLLGGSSFDRTWDPSRLLLKQHLPCPALGDPDFRPRFETLLREYQIDIVFPTTDALVAELAAWRGCTSRVIATGIDSAQICLSKRLIYDRLRGCAPIPTVYEDDAEIAFPAYAKPERGSGSRGAMPVRNRADLRQARADGLVVHEQLPGPEYTVDCVSDLDGQLMVCNVRVRGHVGRGIALGTEAVTHPEIVGYVRRIASRLKIRGPWFVQFKEDIQGLPRLLEVNARVAGSMVLTRLAGINIPLMSAFMFAGWPVRVPRQLEGARIVRHLRSLGEVSDFEWVVWDLDDTIVRTDGRADPDVVARLYDLHNQGKRQLLLTRSSDPQRVIERLYLPPLFVTVRRVADKLAALPALIEQYGLDPERTLIINDSVSENLAIQRAFPKLRTLMPDALDALAREKVE